MIICFEVVFNRVLSNSKTHLFVKLETFSHLHRARAGFGWGHGAVRPPPNIREVDSFKKCRKFCTQIAIIGLFCFVVPHLA
jgi:hypothetical protein